MTPRPRALARPRVVALIAGAVGLLALAVAGAIAFSWRDDLPAEVAVHWGPEGADRFASPTAAILGPLVLGIVLTGALALMTAVIGQSAANRRVSAGVTVGMPVFLGVMLVSTTWAQQAVAEPSTTDIGRLVSGAVGAGVLAGILVAVALPGDTPVPSNDGPGDDAPRLDLDSQTRAVWVRHAQGGPGLAFGVLATAGIVVLTVLTELWFMLFLAALLCLALVATMSWVVTVDATGLTVRSALGYPRTSVPATEVERADVVEVSPMREFGGWGWRAGRGGRLGIVVRSGSSLLVERSGGRSVVVTVDDAETGAALLNTMADRARDAR